MGTGQRTGGMVFANCLQKHGVDLIFGVPGESYLAALDAFYDNPDLKFKVCRQEGGAAMMAEAYGKLTGKPGICMVSRGPGATNASAGLHIAFQDSTPMILFIGQVSRDQQEREAYQELDYRRMFGQVSKWVAEVNNAERLPEFISRAFFTATAGRPGPVVLSLPEDMLEDLVDVEIGPSYQPIYAGPDGDALQHLQQLLSQAKRPLTILGGGAWNEETCHNLRQFAQNWNMPVCVSLRCQDHFNNDDSHYIGELGVGVNPKLAQRLTDADVVLAMGPRLGDMTTSSYTLLKVPVPTQKLIHVHTSAEELGKVYQPVLGINSSVRKMSQALAALKPLAHSSWQQWLQDARADYEDWNKTQPIGSKVQLPKIMASLSGYLPEDAIFCTGAGNYANWIYRFHRYRHYGTQLAPTSGTMGYSIPAAVSAKITYPEKTVIAFAGDGCFMMHGQELAVAAAEGLAIVVIIINNSIYGTIRMHQERAYPGRVIGTHLHNPLFYKLIEAYGGKGYLVKNTEDFYNAFTDALQQSCLTLLDVHIEEEYIGPLLTIAHEQGKGRGKKSRRTAT